MRRLFCLGIAAVAVLASSTAQAVDSPAVTLNVSKFQVRYGDPLRLAGIVTSRKAGVPVDVMARSFTASGFRRVTTVTSVTGGHWLYEVTPKIATTYQVSTSDGLSREVLVGVRPAVTMSKLANGRIRVDVVGGHSFAGRAVKLQERKGGVWSTVAQLHLNSASRALVPSALVPLQATTLRATFSVNQAGQGYLGGFSPPIVIPARWVSLSLTTPELTFGASVMLTGRVSARQAGLPVTVLARQAAEPEFQPLANLMTGAGGRWSLVTHPKVGTVYQAEYAGTQSRMLSVGIHPDPSVRIISGARVWTHVAAPRSLAGRFVQVQQLTEGQWRTIAKATLNKDNVAIFDPAELPGGASTLRIAMSVNQAGTGLMGAFGRAFVYQR
jgi:hypothetical protein